MSLAISLTAIQERLAQSSAGASRELRKLKGIAPAVVYDELMLRLCEITAECNRFKVELSAARMTGELDQRPAAVTAETLELMEGCELQMIVASSAEQARQWMEERVRPDWRRVEMWPEHGIEQAPKSEVWKIKAAADDTLKPEEDDA